MNRLEGTWHSGDELVHGRGGAFSHASNNDCGVAEVPTAKSDICIFGASVVFCSQLRQGKGHIAILVACMNKVVIQWHLSYANNCIVSLIIAS